VNAGRVVTCYNSGMSEAEKPTIREMVLGALACCAAAVFVAWLCDRWPGSTSAYYFELFALTTIGVLATFMLASFLRRRRDSSEP